MKKLWVSLALVLGLGLGFALGFVVGLKHESELERCIRLVTQNTGHNRRIATLMCVGEGKR